MLIPVHADIHPIQICAT